ncbi:MAG TPA: CAP domain-containing protein [Dehalococcoidia bacterium]|nr:CAP domain-containing protein [Dehalococcoidia bacterium]
MRITLPARRFWLPAALAAAIALPLLLTSAQSPRPAEALTNCSVTDQTFDSEEQQFLTLINQYRAQNGLGALTASTNLNRAASWLANDMAIKNYMSHTDSLGRSLGPRLQQCDTFYSSAAENIAAGYTTAASVFNGWRNSSGHNVNMLGAAYKQIGIARVYGASSTYGWYWATDFSSVDDGTRAGGGGTVPTATATATRTSTAAATATRTATSTPAPASPTPTRTASPVATSTQTSTGAKAVMTSPAPGSRFTSTTVTFSWSAATNASEYFLYIGTSAGSNNMYGRSQGLNRSVTLSGFPSNGSTVYVRLWTRVGTTWSYNDYTYRTR